MARKRVPFPLHGRPRGTAAAAGTTVARVPVRRPDPARMLGALNAQRAALGEPEWPGPVTAEALGAACVRAVLAALDAGAAPEREALRWAVTDLLGLLAAQAPGRAVEVRIPPYAAIQCVEGPRHTRGTPPNVVETDPVTWIMLAAGRIPWAGRGGGRPPPRQRPPRRPLRLPAPRAPNRPPLGARAGPGFRGGGPREGAVAPSRCPRHRLRAGSGRSGGGAR